MQPKISIVIPTLNAQNVLETCLRSIHSQNYQNHEIIICDGGSNDKTLSIAQKYKCKIINNHLKTAESGKAVGLKSATGKYVAFIDSDNILPNNSWLDEMIYPLEKDDSLIGSEPWEFTYRPNSGFTERYSSLIGANDPYAFILGIRDRRNVFSQSWNDMNIAQQEHKRYIKIKLEPQRPIPTIGANGTVFKTVFIKRYCQSDYLFDIDSISSALGETQKPLFFAKTKNRIIHTWCESSIPKFYRKQMRRLKDYYQFKSIRQFNYKNNFSRDSINNLLILVKNNIVFVAYTILIVPMFFTSIYGYIRRPDRAWLFHPIACVITLYCYVYVSILYLLGVNTVQSRQTWSQ